MSYSSDLKRQLAEKEVKKNCCRRALLYGVLSVRGELSTDNEVVLSLEAASVAPLCEAEVRRSFGTVPRKRLLGPRKSRAILSFSSQQAADHIRSGEVSYPQKTPPCQQCYAHFLRGIFLGAGRISDFKKLYRLEFSADERIEQLCEVLTAASGEPKRAERRGEQILYYKANAAICDFLASMGAENAAFDLINDTIEAGYRNAANRRANCEAKNIEKSVEASMRFVGILRRLMAADKFSRLPEELQETARLRAENPTLSLATLGSWCTPPVSKSGMNHRLEKIEKIAKELLGTEEEE